MTITIFLIALFGVAIAGTTAAAIHTLYHMAHLRAAARLRYDNQKSYDELKELYHEYESKYHHIRRLYYEESRCTCAYCTPSNWPETNGPSCKLSKDYRAAIESLDELYRLVNQCHPLLLTLNQRDRIRKILGLK